MAAPRPLLCRQELKVETTGGSHDGNSRPSNSEPRVPASRRTRRVGGGSCKWGWEALLRTDFFGHGVSWLGVGAGWERNVSLLPPFPLPFRNLKVLEGRGKERKKRGDVFGSTHGVGMGETVYLHHPSGSEARKRARCQGTPLPLPCQKGALDIRQGAADGTRVVPGGR